MRTDGRGYKREKARDWRPEEAPADSAPTWHPDWPKLEEWAVGVDEAADTLRRLMCPVCGEGPWKLPLTHVAKRHGIDRFSMRDACGLTTTESLGDPATLQRRADLSRGRDMSAITEASRSRKKQRWTKAGRAGNAARLAAWEQENPEAAAAAHRAAGLAAAEARWGTAT